MQPSNVFQLIVRNSISILLPKRIWDQFDVCRNAPDTDFPLPIDVDAHIVHHCIAILGAHGDTEKQRNAVEKFYQKTKNDVIGALRQLEYLQCSTVHTLYCARLFRDTRLVRDRRTMQKLYNVLPRCSLGAETAHESAYSETNSDFALLLALA